MEQLILCQEMQKLAWDLLIFIFCLFFEYMRLASLVGQIWPHFPLVWHIVDFSPHHKKMRQQDPNFIYQSIASWLTSRLKKSKTLLGSCWRTNIIEVKGQVLCQRNAYLPMGSTNAELERVIKMCANKIPS
jgi:hypothetical protein